MVGQVGTGDSLQVGFGHVCSRASRKTIILGLYSVSTVLVAFSGSHFERCDVTGAGSSAFQGAGMMPRNGCGGSIPPGPTFDLLAEAKK